MVSNMEKGNGGAIKDSLFAYMKGNIKMTKRTGMGCIIGPVETYTKVNILMISDMDKVK
jgi:hypothetical protein